MKDYLSAAFALLAATSQAAVLQAASTAPVICHDPAQKVDVEYNGYCYAPEDPLALTPPADCCWLYPKPNFVGDQLEMCFSTKFDDTHPLHRTETIYHSMAGNGQFDNDAESWWCGANAALQACNDTINTNPSEDNAWTYECTGTQGPLFTGGSNSGNKNLNRNTNNFASTFVIKPIESCVAQLTLYSEPSCEGESRVIMNNQLTEMELLSIFTAKDARVKSFTHAEGSTVKIWSEEGLKGEHVEFNTLLPGETVCASAVLTEDQDAGKKGDAIPQKSLEFTRPKSCN